MPSKLLRRKTSRRNKTKKSIEKDFDLFKFKDQMSKEMSRFKNKISNPQFQPILSDYDKRYKQYISEGFTYSTLMLINRIFSDSKTLPRDLRNNYPLHSLIIKIIRQLMMNELELVYFSIYLDNFGWKSENFEILDHFLVTGMSVKVYLNANTEYLENYLCTEYPGFMEKFKDWIKNKTDYNNLIQVSPRDINTRFNQLKRPYNSYCKNNFIDYNESVDRILHMSLPYSEGMKHPNSDKGYYSLDEGKSQKKLQKGKKEKKEEKKKLISFRVEKNPVIPKPIPVNKSMTNLNLMGSRPSTLHFDKPLNPTTSMIFNQPSSTNLNLAMGQHSTMSNVNYNQFLNFNHSTSIGNFNNNIASNYQHDLIKQQSEINFNENPILLGRTTSGLDPGLLQRNSQQFLDGQDEALTECFFKPIDLKPNYSITSLVSDFKGNDQMYGVGLGKMISTTSNIGNGFKGILNSNREEELKGAGLGVQNSINSIPNSIPSNIPNNLGPNIQTNLAPGTATNLKNNLGNNLKDNFNLYPTLSAVNSNLNSFGNDLKTLGQSTHQGRKNLLNVYLKMESEQKKK